MVDVSVIIPVYNVEPYLQDCLDSVLSQTGYSIEVICIDDGSTDGSSAILDAAAEKDARVRVIKQENAGLSVARNRGLDVACGRYVIFVDSDDMLVEGAIGNLLSLADKENLDHIIFGANAFIDDRFGFVDNKKLMSCENYYRVKDDSVFFHATSGMDLFKQLIDIDSFYVPVPLRFIRRESIERKGLRFFEGVVHEDNHFTPLALLHAERASIIPQKYYLRRLRSGSIMTSEDIDIRHAAGCFAVAVRLKEAFGELGSTIEAAADKYIGFLLDLGAMYMARVRNDNPQTSLLKELESVCTKEECRTVQRIVWPLINHLEKANARIQKYKDKRLSNRIKRLFRRKQKQQENRNTAPNDLIAISVIVPVYNAERNLRQALDSLSAQTLKNVEFICIDDGSRDSSGSILDEYAARDKRFRVFHTVNRGAANARNFGLSRTRSEYLAFMDADDHVEPTWLEDMYGISRKNKLDICICDFEVFSDKTGDTLPHWWTLKNQAENLVFNKVISPAMLKRWALAGNVWSCLFDRRFITKNAFHFFQLKPADDAHFLYSAMFKAKRIYFHPRVYLHYRRDQETSIVAKHGKNYESQKACLAAIAELYKNIRHGFCKQAIKRAFLWRFLHDILYAGENVPHAAEWLADGGLTDSLRIESLRKQDVGKALLSRIEMLAKRFTTSIERPKEVEKLIDSIEATRFGKKKDLYIITGQLNSKTNEPIDSWTFFRHLQSKGIPSRYVIWRKHYFLKEIKRQGLMKDVIVLRGNGVKNFEFLEKCRKELIHAKAVIQENGAIEAFTAKWLRELSGCEYVFLQHGVFGMSLSKSVSEWISNAFNTINVSSRREREFLEKGFSEVKRGNAPRFIIAGLPRWDRLKDISSGESEKIVFVMMTWRSTFNEGMDTLKKSAYYRGLKALLSKENLEEIKKIGLKVVWAPHHHMANRIKDLEFEFGDHVTVAKTSEISGWIAKSSICITDFSSVSADFLFLNKPVIYWVPDIDDPLLDPCDGNAGAKVKSACENLSTWFNVAMSENEVMDYLRHYASCEFELEPGKRELAKTLFDCKEDICGHLLAELESPKSDSPSEAN